MQLYFLTSVGWSLDSSGNLQARDTAGTLLAKFLSGKLSTGGNVAIVTQSVSLTTVSLSFVSTGFGVTLTPQVSTRVRISGSLVLGNGTANDGFQLGLYYNTTSVPANGAVPTGTNFGISMQGTSATANALLTLAFSLIVSALTAGTTYNFYLVYSSLTGGTTTQTQGILTAEEV